MTHIPEAVAWTLIHFCWQAAAIAGGYALISLVLARRSPEARYTAALASMLLMLALAGGTLRMGTPHRSRTRVVRRLLPRISPPPSDR